MVTTSSPSSQNDNGKHDHVKNHDHIKPAQDLTLSEHGQDFVDDNQDDLVTQDVALEDAAQEPIDDDLELSTDFINRVREAIEQGDEERIIRLCGELHAADQADLLEYLDADERAILVPMMGANFDADTLIEVDETIRDELLESMPTDQLAEAITDMETDEAAYVMEDMEDAAREEVLAEVPAADRIAIKSALDYEEDTAGRLMQRDVFAAPSYWSVGQILSYLQEADDLPDSFFEVFVVDPTFKVIGSVPLSDFVRAPRDRNIADMVREGDLLTIPAQMDQEEVAYLFGKYNLISAPVVDENNRLKGMITVDDVVEIAMEETHEDMLALAGVEAEQSGVSVSIRAMLRSRFGWLLINLFTAILASIVISLFGATLDQAVALAILMPIVASMGGNAGTQTLTVAVRNLATKDMNRSNSLKIIGREGVIAFVNGCAFAAILAITAGLWYGTIGGGGTFAEGLKMASVISMAMVINMLAAGMAGILIPLGLHRAGADPAVSSTVFVTTVTDVVGFFTFLGLAALILI